MLKRGLGHSPKRGEGGSPTLSPGMDAEIERPKALQDAKPTKRSYRDRGFTACFIKTYFFYNLCCPV